MKKIIVITSLLLASFATAQSDSGIGIKGGVNYGSTGELRRNGETIIENPDDKVGFHVGVFGKIKITDFYIRPEVFYTQLNSEYNGVDAQVQKIDAPVLLGYNILGPVSIFAGPSFQYILDTDLQDVTLDDVQEDFTIGAQIGIGVGIKNVGIDVRYERGFTENEARYTQIGNVGTLDTRPQQITVALSFLF